MHVTIIGATGVLGRSLIPRLVQRPIGSAVRRVRRHGRWTATGRGALSSGLILTVVTAFFLLDVEWIKWWPLLLVLFGIGALMNELLPG